MSTNVHIIKYKIKKMNKKRFVYGLRPVVTLAGIDA